MLRCAAAADGEHQREVVLHGPIDVGIGDGVVAALGTGTFHAQPLEDIEHLGRHLMGPAQIHGVGGQPLAARLGRGHTDAGGAEGPAAIAKFQNQRVSAEHAADLRLDLHHAATGR
ncbi:MAG: hypothetical protein ABSG53_10645 [Thermoguttaceae bacterium]